MFSTLRNRFGIPGVISVIALVFALVGGAFAANNSSNGNGATASAKKSAKGPRGPRGRKGVTGAAGPAGPAGAPGAKGDAGAAGANGQNGSPGTSGKDGKGVTSASFEGTDEPLDEPCEGTGGVEFKSASPTTYACNGVDGENGEPWTAGGTLPVGATETGAWGFSGPSTCAEPDKCTSYSFAGPIAAISFPIPLAAAIEGSKVIYVPPSFEAPNPDPTNCPGSPSSPEAASGYLCIYTEVASTLPTPQINASRAGVVLLYIGTDTSAAAPFAFGSFAVTG
jgi:hypothetical protein